MGIPNEELKSIADQYIEETEDNIEIELAEFVTEGWTINDKETATKVDYLIHKMEEKIEEDEAIASNQKAVLQVKIDKLEEGKTKLDEWLERSTKIYKSRIDDLKTHLHLYHQRVVEAEEEENKKRIADGKKPLKVSKSIKLPYRDLTSKQQQPEIKKDDEKLTQWVSENDSFVIPLAYLNNVISEKEANQENGFTVQELLEIIKSNESQFIKREPKLAWGEYKKSLEAKVVDNKLVYVNEGGQVVPHVELIEQGVKFDWKLNKG